MSNIRASRSRALRSTTASCHLYALDDQYGPGFHVITPLRLADGQHRARQPRLRAERAEGSGASAPPGRSPATSTVTGLLRVAGRASACSFPTTTPQRNIWYWRDIGAMAAALGPADAPRVHQFIVDAEASPPAPGGWPKGGVTRLELPNRHLEYALTWYGLAADAGRRFCRLRDHPLAPARPPDDRRRRACWG